MTDDATLAKMKARWQEVQDGRWTDPAAPRITVPVDAGKRERERWAEADQQMREGAAEWAKHLDAERGRVRQAFAAEAEALIAKLTGP